MTYSEHRNNRGRVIIFDIGEGPGGGFGGPGGGFSDRRSSGKPLLLLRLKKPPPGRPKPPPGPQKPPPVTPPMSKIMTLPRLFRCSE